MNDRPEATDDTPADEPMEIEFPGGLRLSTVAEAKNLPKDQPGQSPILALKREVARLRHAIVVGFATAHADAKLLQGALLDQHGRLAAIEELIVALAEEGKIAPESVMARKALERIKKIQAKREADAQERALVGSVQDQTEKGYRGAKGGAGSAS